MAGIAWITGLLAGLAEAGRDVTGADLLVGTSAGALASEPQRRAVIEARLPSHEWPERAVKIVAVDAMTGQPRVFDNTSGVSLVDAVTASCAVPGIWPPATIEGHRYVDGGVRSAANADYAAGASRVLVILPLGRDEPFPCEKPLVEAVAELRGAGRAPRSRSWNRTRLRPRRSGRTRWTRRPVPRRRRPAARRGGR